MAKFREFYVQSGAGMNYLALKCLWTDDSNMMYAEPNTTINEFYSHIQQTKINNADKRNAFQILTLSQFKEDDEDLISESKRILPILIELKNMSKQANTTEFDRLITEVKNNTFWKNDNVINWSEIRPFEQDQTLIKEAKDYFAKSREYYYSIFERNDWDCFNMSHQHPNIVISTRLKLPTTFKSLAMELDVDMSFYSDTLYDIKRGSISRVNVENDYSAMTLYGNFYYEANIIMCKLSDDTVSYRKIFFENDSDEIRKMYDFFDNEEYFDKNKMSIMKEFKEYHEANMALIQKFAPEIYKKLS